jgi:[Skp1-protein]-hydroxyproline N-acetylglucosaminyltransferase
MSIFVTIPSYRDSECQHTISDLINKAKFPQNISFGVCFQYDKEADQHCLAHWPKELFPNQIRVDYVDYREATGPCWARYRAQQLYREEDYWFSIDSHMRAVEHWDQLVIDLLQQCHSAKAIITAYPHDYTLPNQLSAETRPIVTCAKPQLGPDHMLRVEGKLLIAPTPQPIPALFWVSGCSFSRARALVEVPYDPHLPQLFFGEESSMTARLWTSGWDFYAPGRVVLYHLWSRDHRPSFRENKDVTHAQRRSQQRVHYILGKIDHVEDETVLQELSKYGIDTPYKTRDLAAFQRHCGVNFCTGEITEYAQRGGVEKKLFLDSIFDLIAQYTNKQ